jgi:hypothetical protein
MPELWPGQWTSIIAGREIPNQRLCCLERYIFTVGLLTHATFDYPCYRYAARYCYPTLAEAKEALATWDGKGDPPGPWIKEKISERLGPGAERRLGDA